MRNLLLMSLIGLAVACGAGAQDIYTGTLETRGGTLFLKRCDLGSTEYRLIDHETDGTRPVATLLKASIVTPTSASVLGIYEEDGADRHALNVLDIQNIAPGKSCHLIDALGDIESASKPDGR